MTFTKEVLTNFHSNDFGLFENCNLYQLHDNNKIIGQFIISETVAFISTNEPIVRIDINNHFFKPSAYTIFELPSNIQIGCYKIPSWTIGWKEIGSMELDNIKYFCTKQKAEIRSNIFKKSTWGHYKLVVTNNNTEIVYKLKVETAWLEAPNAEFRNAHGEISSNKRDTKLILAGMFFIERMLNIIDNNSY
jgi:hypothetical protein